MVLRQRREREELDAFLAQGLGLLARGLAVDAARRGLLVVDLARLLGEARTDVLRLGLDLGAHLAHGGGQLAVGGEAVRLGLRLRGRSRGLRRGGRLSGGLGRPLLGGALGDAGRHQRLLDPGRAAARTVDLAALGLAVEGRAVGEPGLELVTLVAFEPVADHEASLLNAAGARPIWNGRSCCSEGMRARASPTLAGSISATITPGSAPPASATTSPQGATMRLCP